jgi:hypothetical protein
MNEIERDLNFLGIEKLIDINYTEDEPVKVQEFFGYKE